MSFIHCIQLWFNQITTKVYVVFPYNPGDKAAAVQVNTHFQTSRLPGCQYKGPSSSVKFREADQFLSAEQAQSSVLSEVLSSPLRDHLPAVSLDHTMSQKWRRRKKNLLFKVTAAEAC
ncbi:hypothetical protein ATANTOWER_010462 [Ataeniobius toweri]|uniref:Uncharacterized protein n=1 Tax=Ataeniobius toweri TaxID=208326 RepID=A0ABU7AAH4_9TELE|nr:hypothetical protein [Ataeniobius toweri]